MQQREIAELISKLSDMDVTNYFKDEIEVLEHQLKSAGDELAHDIIMSEYNQLAEKIRKENESKKL